MDLRLVEIGDGGDFVVKGKDLEIIFGFQNMPYLGLFGGNIEADTGIVNSGEQRFDWWGNSLLLSNQPTIQFNSKTERLLNNVSVTSAGRLEVEQTVIEDLKFLEEFATVDVEVLIISTDRISIEIRIQEPSNLESNEFIFIWDATKQELSAPPSVTPPPLPIAPFNFFLNSVLIFNGITEDVEINGVTVFIA